MLSSKLKAASKSLDTAWDLDYAEHPGDTLTNYVLPKAPLVDYDYVFVNPNKTKVYANIDSASSVGNARAIAQFNFRVPGDYTSIYLEYIYDTAISGDSYRFSSDGTKFYYTDSVGYVHYFNLSTAWDLSTASFNYKTLIPNIRFAPAFSSDGTKVYCFIDASFNPEKVIEYTLGTAWELSTITSSVEYIGNIDSHSGFPRGISLSDDDTTLYFPQTRNYYQVVMSTAADITTAPATSTSILNNIDFSSTLSFTDSGFRAHIGAGDNAWFELELTTAYDVTTYTYNSSNYRAYHGVAANAGDYLDTADMSFLGDNGTKLYRPYNQTWHRYTYDSINNPTRAEIRYASTTVSRFDLTIPYDLTTAQWVADANIPAAISSYTNEEGMRPSDIYFKPDGTKAYVTEQFGTAADEGFIRQVNLTTPWDLTTATSVATWTPTGLNDYVGSVEFKPDGTRIFITLNPTDGSATRVVRGDLSTPWDLSTVSYVDSNDIIDVPFNFPGTTGIDDVGGPISFNSDGTSYIVTRSGTYDFNAIYKFDLDSPYDLSNQTATDYNDDLEKFAFSSFTSFTYGSRFVDSGNKIFYSTQFAHAIIDLNTAYDITSSTLVTNNTNILSDESGAGTVSSYISPDGINFYVLENTGTLRHWILSKPNDINTAVYNTFTTLSTYISGIQANTYSSLYFKGDGTRMYIGSNVSDEIYQLNLTTAWDLGSISTSTNRDFGDQTTGLFVGDEGSKLYVMRGGDRFDQYTLNTPWDISSSSSAGNIDMSGTLADNPRGFALKSDGTSIFILTGTSPLLTIREWELGIPWDITSIGNILKDFAYSATEYIAPNPNFNGSFTPSDITFSHDGKFAYITNGIYAAHIQQLPIG